MKNIKRLLFLSCLLVVTAICFLVSNLITSSNSVLHAVSYTQQEDDYVKKINSEVNELRSDYSLDSYYTFLAENQGDTDLCWVFSSSKVLETSFLKQKNEYHNISEAGMALLNYKYKTLPSATIKSDLKKIDISGDFSNFNEVAQEYGIIYENQLSNDVLFDVNESNYENYSYIFDHVDTKFMDNVMPIDFNESLTYHNFSAEEKQNFLKKYIMNYGGIFGGLKSGMISSKNVYISNKLTGSGAEKNIYTSHAVCIIGWNDNIPCGDQGTGAFYAINSWGVSTTSFSKIYIPYSYGDLLDDVYGYICTDVNPIDNTTPVTDSIEVVSTTAGTKDGDEVGFTKKFLSSNTSINPNNLFVYGEELELTYHITGDFAFTNTFVKIYQGQSDVTSHFSVSYDDENRNVIIGSDDERKLSECYNIEFYNENQYIGTEEIFIFTGTEVSYIEFIEESNNKSVDSSLFNNNFASNNFSQTYYIYSASPTREYSLNFYLPDINLFTYDKLYLSSSSVEISITETLEETDENGIIKRTPITRPQNKNEDVSVEINTYQTWKNYFQIIISDLTRNMMGKTVNLKVPVISDDMNDGTGKVTDYYFHFIISSSTSSMSSKSNRIVYNLDGGENDARNVNRYPNYINETIMTDFELFNPSKDGYGFIGWFDVNNFEVEKISNQLSGNIVLYAKWEKTEETYFELDVKISKLEDYYGNTKQYTDGTKIIYGDSVFVDMIFTPGEGVQKYQFSTRYSYTFTGNGILISENGDLQNSGETIRKLNSFIAGEGNDREIQLVCGTYNIEFDVTMVVSHKVVVQKKVEFEYTVNPKVITANYDENSKEFTYDKNNHRPMITSFNGVYDEDGEIAYSFDNTEQFRQGTYNYKIKSIKNRNYKIDENQEVFTMKINPAKLTIEWNVTEKVYNGENQLPDYTLNGIVGNDDIQINFGKTENLASFVEMKDVGVYNISVESWSNSNYIFSGNTSTVFEIIPADIKIIFNDMTRSFAIALDNLKPTYVITWVIDGTLYGDDDESKLNISYYCEAENTTKSGDYPIIGSYSNKNYNAEIVNGNYKILSSYYIFYNLPDGREVFEYVEEGHEPVGITPDIYKVPFLSKLVYEEVSELDGASDRVFVNVKVVSYRWIVYFVGVVLGLLIFYRISTRRARKNRTR